MYLTLLEIWRNVTSWHWLLDGVANTLILFVIARLVIFGYREHSYLYQLDSGSKMLDAWIDVVLPLIKRLNMPRYRAHVDMLLSRSGIRKGWSADHFIASQAIYAGGVFVVAFILLKIVLGFSAALPVLAGMLATLFPYLKLYDIATTRYVSCNRDLPFVLDYLCLAMGAGLDFNQAMKVVIDDAPRSPLIEEFELVMRNTRLGMSRADALIEMDRRLSSPVVKQFVQTLVQGMELGTDIVRTIKSLSERIQQKRFQLAEEKAGKISVRMMIPMMCFVMPAVMIILLGPMMLAYIQQA